MAAGPRDNRGSCLDIHFRSACAWTLAGLLAGCSGAHPVPTGPVSREGAGKAAFNEARAIDRISQAGYTHITIARRDADGTWRGKAVRKGDDRVFAVSVTEAGPVVASATPN